MDGFVRFFIITALLCSILSCPVGAYFMGQEQAAKQANADQETTGQLTESISDQAGAIETLSNTVSEMAHELVNMANRLIDAKQEQVNDLKQENNGLRVLLYGAALIILALVILPKLKRKDKTA